MILIAALGFAAVSATGPDVEPVAIEAALPESLSSRVAAAGFAAMLNPEIEVVVPDTQATFAVEASPAPRSEPAPTTTTTTTTTTSTTAPPATTTTTTAAPPPTTTTTTAAPPPTTTTTTTTPPAATTTTAPTPTTTAPPADGGPRDVEEWRSLVAEHFPAELVDEALSVMRCESLGDPLAYNSSSGASGLFQFIPGTWSWASPNAGFGGASPFEPDANIGTAAWLVQTSIDQGKDAWVHWSCKP